MSYAPNPYAASSPYAPPGGGAPRRPNLGLIGAVVIASTVLVLGSILLVAYLVNRDDERTVDDTAAEDSASVEGETVEDAEDGPTAAASNDPEEVAIAVAKILYGVSDESSAGLVCAEPGANLADVDATGASMREHLGEEYFDLIDDIVATGSTGGDASTEVALAFVIFGSEADAGSVDLVVEDGLWKACDYSY